MSYFGQLSKGKPKTMSLAAIAQRKQASRLSADKRKRAAAARREAVRKRV